MAGTVYAQKSARGLVLGRRVRFNPPNAHKHCDQQCALGEKSAGEAKRPSRKWRRKWPPSPFPVEQCP